MARARTNRYQHVCRNGHPRTAENTYTAGNGQRQCKDCPGWQRNQLSTKQRQELTPEERYHQVLSPTELEYLRSLIPCLGCGVTPGDGGVTYHKAGCAVAFHGEHDDEPRRKTRAAA